MSNKIVLNNEDDSDVEQKIQLPYFQRSFNIVEHHFYFTDTIGHPSDYIHFYNALNTASENDIFRLYLNTNGGRLDTGVQIINCIRNTPGTVITVLQSQAHSLGTLIFLSGHQKIVQDHTRMMFHNFFGGVSGKGQEMQFELQSTSKWYEKIMKEICVPFLSDREVSKIIKGQQDLWMDADEIRKRLERIPGNDNDEFEG